MECRLIKTREWAQLCKALDSDIYFCPQYSMLYEQNGEGKACCFFYAENDDNFVIYPFLMREIPGAVNYYDITTPYGYGGALKSSGKVNMKDFYKYFDVFCENENIVSEFVRFHLFDVDNNSFPGKVVKASKNIVVELRKDVQQLWMEYKHKVRKNVKKAQRSGLKVSIDREFKHLQEFHEIYLDTMERVSAGNYYKFSIGFFENLVQGLRDKCVLFHTWLENKIVSTELLLHSKKYINSFLGGTCSEFFELRPNDILKHEVILWAKAKGLKLYVLGGGNKPDDGIYRYKKSFSKSPDVDFYVGRKVHDEVIYHQLCEEKIRRENLDSEEFYGRQFFPLYRS